MRLREFIKQQVKALEAAWNKDLAAATAQQRSYTDRQAFRLVIVFLIATLGALLGQSAIQYYGAAAHAADAGHQRLPRGPGLAVQASAVARRCW